MKNYIKLDEHNYVISHAAMKIEGFIEIEGKDLPSNFYKKAMDSWKYENGTFICDETRQSEWNILVSGKIRKREVLSRLDELRYDREQVSLRVRTDKTLKEIDDERRSLMKELKALMKGGE